MHFFLEVLDIVVYLQVVGPLELHDMLTKLEVYFFPFDLVDLLLLDCQRGNCAILSCIETKTLQQFYRVGVKVKHI